MTPSPQEIQQVKGACEHCGRPPIKWPTEEEVQKEVWSRIHRHESAKEFPLPQKIMREITAEAYWSACYRWLKSFVEKGQEK